MTTEIQALEQKLETFRGAVGERFDEVGVRFDRVHDDLKDLTKALRDLIRIDGDIRRLQDATGRIGRECEDHEKRLRVLEQDGAGTRVKVGVIGRGQLLLFSTIAAGLGAVFSGVVVYALTH